MNKNTKEPITGVAYSLDSSTSSSAKYTGQTGHFELSLDNNDINGELFFSKKNRYK